MRESKTQEGDVTIAFYNFFTLLNYNNFPSFGIGFHLHQLSVRWKSSPKSVELLGVNSYQFLHRCWPLLFTEFFPMIIGQILFRSAENIRVLV